jgi:hypothetical protein
MSRDTLPLLLREAVISLYPADAAGAPLVAAPVWAGACANGLRLGQSWEEQLSYSSGDRFKTAHHADELHAIEIDRTWIIRTTSPGETSAPERNARYVMEIVWNDVRARIWHKRLYYGVTGRASDLNSDGPRQHNNAQSYRAETFVPDGGTGAANIFTPIATTGAEQVVGFFGENPVLEDAYLLGHYRWSANKRITAARWACLSPTAETVLGLELNGILSGDTITIPAGVANTDAHGEVTLNRLVPLGTEVRWRVVSGPDIEAAAWHLAVVVTLADG